MATPRPSTPRSTSTRRPSPSRIGSTCACGCASRVSPSTPPSPRTGRRRVPVAFGWHPYLRVPGTPRARWRLRLPPREHRALDARSIPTGASTHEPRGGSRSAGERTTTLRARARPSAAYEGDDGAAIEMRCGDGYPFAQVWVPTGRTFGALEPMAAPTTRSTRDDAARPSRRHVHGPVLADGDLNLRPQALQQVVAHAERVRHRRERRVRTAPMLGKMLVSTT